MKNKINDIILFILGALCFFISEILLRVPILNLLSRSIVFNRMSMNYSLIITILIIFSAGLFEEGFRFLFRNFLLRDDEREERGLISFRNVFSSALIFGLGHGLCEVGEIFTQTGFNLTLLHYALIILERIFAVVFHISMTILIFRGFNINKKYLFTVIAMALHFIFNISIIFKGWLGIFGIYLCMFIVDLVILSYIFKIKNKFEGDIINEEI